MGRNDLGGKRQSMVSVRLSVIGPVLERNEALTFFSRCISISVNVNVIRRQNCARRAETARRGCMSDHIFQDAYARVRGRHTDQAWFALSPREITDPIYREMRVIDSDRVGSRYGCQWLDGT